MSVNYSERTQTTLAWVRTAACNGPWKPGSPNYMRWWQELGPEGRPAHPC